MFQVCSGVLLGILGTITTYTVVQWIGITTLCGEQLGVVCAQQWLAATLPAIALMLAGYGSVQIGKQIRQGQASVDANELTQLRDQYDVLSKLRDGLLERQRLLEKFDLIYKSPATLPVGPTWDMLEKVQYQLDYFVEDVSNSKREPYLYHHQKALERYRVTAFARSELFRNIAQNWDNGNASDARMARCVFTIKATMLKDMINVRTSLDNLIKSFGEKVAKITKAEPDASKQIFAEPVFSKISSTAKPPSPSKTDTIRDKRISSRVE